MIFRGISNETARFCTKRTITPTINESDLQGRWATTMLPLVLKRHAAATAVPRTIWVRVNLDAFAGRRGPLDLYLVRWIAAGQLSIYGDGRLIYRSTGTPTWNLSTRPAALVPLVRADDGTPPRTVLLRLDWLAGPTAALSSLYVGDPRQVDAKARHADLLERQIPFMMSVAFVMLGLFGFGLWLLQRSYPGHLIFVAAALGLVWRWHFYLGAQNPVVPDAWFIWLTTNVALWQTINAHFLLCFLHGRRQPRLNAILIAGSLVIAVIGLPVGPSPLPTILRWFVGMYLAIVPLNLIVAGIGGWNAWRARATDAGLIAGALLLGSFAAVADVIEMSSVAHVESLYLTTYTMRFFALVCVYLMFRHYVRALREIRTSNAMLEQRVHEREAELAENYVQLREIERRQILSDERQRLMQDMHDGLGSSLTSALRVVENRHSDAELETVIRKCVDDLKLTVDSLEPVDGDLLLLLATLRYRFGPRLQSSGISLIWEVTDVPKLDWLNPRCSLHILRILQEALANILQHTRATEIRVATGADDHSVQITVTDNGNGFDVDSAMRRGGRGLANQQRRAAEMGGKVEWHSSATGTRLGLVLPRYAS